MLYRLGLKLIERKHSTDERIKESHTFLACKPITSWTIYIVPLELMEKAKSRHEHSPGCEYYSVGRQPSDGNLKQFDRSTRMNLRRWCPKGPTTNGDCHVDFAQTHFPHGFGYLVDWLLTKRMFFGYHSKNRKRRLSSSNTHCYRSSHLDKCLWAKKS